MWEIDSNLLGIRSVGGRYVQDNNFKALVKWVYFSNESRLSWMLDSDFASGLRNFRGCSKVIQAKNKIKFGFTLCKIRIFAGNSAAAVLKHFVEVLTFVKVVEKWSMDS